MSEADVPRVIDVLKAQQGPDCAPRPAFEDGGWFGECAGCEWVGPERVGQYDAVKDWERWHTPLLAEEPK